MKERAAFLIILGVLASLGWTAVTDKAALAKKQDRLTAEYALAKEANFYFVLDVRGRTIELRVRSMVLKSWPIEGLRFWGRPEFGGSVGVVRKTALRAPERIVIKPGETEETVKPAPAAKAGAAAPSSTAGDYDLEAIEIRDMPKRFTLDLDNGLHISIKSGTGESPGLWIKLKEAWRWYIGLPLRDLMRNRKGPAPAEFELTLGSDQDAQAVYWHFFDGIKGIII